MKPTVEILSFGSSSAWAKGSLSLTSNLAIECYSLVKLKISIETTNINWGLNKQIMSSHPNNEPILDYEPGSTEKEALL